MTVEDLSTTCPDCGARMSPEHAHYRCRMCGYRDTCCDGAPAQPCTVEQLPGSARSWPSAPTIE